MQKTPNRLISSKHPVDRNPLSITQLNRQAKRLLESNFSSVWVTGEMSNLSRPSSGHWYFSLKDNGAQVRCAMFRSSNNRLRFQVEAGQQIMARAKLSLYEARGDYQLIIEHMEPVGDGALAQAFEQLKQKLQAEGLFDTNCKRPLPQLPQHIAVVSSATGAAFQDMLTVLSRRFASIPVTLLPTAVQGKSAATEISAAIELANRLATDGRYNFDVILVGRGGGSLEDLWPFNEEIVARAIYNSVLPVVSAVGHEVDFTIADFVADIRAATPSAAAEMLSPDSDEMLNTFSGFEQLLQQQLQQKITLQKQQLQWLQSRLRHPGSRLQEHQQRLDELEIRLLNNWQNQQQRQQLNINLMQSRLQQQTPNHLIQRLKQNSANLYQRLERHIQQHLTRQQQRLENGMHLLDTVSPLATMQRGYAIVTDEKGNIISDACTVSSGQKILTRLAKGFIESTVDKTLTNNPRKKQ